MDDFAHSRAVIIGIDTYSNGIPPLPNAVNDANELADILRSRHGYDVSLMVNQGATAQALLSQFSQLAEGPFAVTEDDRLLIYFAGHGIALDALDDGVLAGYILPADAHLGDLSTYISMRMPYEELSKLPCRHLLLILDCCFAGSVQWNASRSMFGPRPMQRLYKEEYESFLQNKARQVIVSTSAEQQTSSAEFGIRFGVRRNRRGHSPFAWALFDALRQGKADLSQPPDGVITATELALYLRERVGSRWILGGQSQTAPVWRLPQYGFGEYIFLVPGAELRLPSLPPLESAPPKKQKKERKQKDDRDIDKELESGTRGGGAIDSTSDLLKTWLDMKRRELDMSLNASDVVKPTAYLTTRFEHVDPEEPLRVNRRYPFVVSVGATAAANLAEAAYPFQFNFPDDFTPVHFRVDVQGDASSLTIRQVEPELVVAPPGRTIREAEFLITPLRPGIHTLYTTVTQVATGATVQHVWRPVLVADEDADSAGQPSGGRNNNPLTVEATPERAIQFPLDTTSIKQRSARITFFGDGSSDLFHLSIEAHLPRGYTHKFFTLKLTPSAIEQASLRLRTELEKLGNYRVPRRSSSSAAPHLDELSLPPERARELIAPVADAGLFVWEMLFVKSKAGEDLLKLAEEIRSLPHGSSVQVVLRDYRMVIPWALLYDITPSGGQVTQVTAENLDWNGFWGYRYILDTLVPRDYPQPFIEGNPPAIHVLLNDEKSLHPFASATEQFVRNSLSGALVDVAWGDAGVRGKLRELDDADFLYFYCHGSYIDATERPGSFPGESWLRFSYGKYIRLVDLARTIPGHFQRNPLVFLNACEGATRNPFSYDDFMQFFIETKQARGFVGAEIKVPALLAHRLALDFFRAFMRGEPVGRTLWELRRKYLDKYHNILAFSYTLYGLEEIRLAQPLVIADSAANVLEKDAETLDPERSQLP